MTRPRDDEYAPFYAGYVALVPEDEILPVLESQGEAVRQICRRVPAAQESLRYAEGKWSVREVLGHLGDAERVFGYRVLCFGRGEEAPLPGFDEEEYVRRSPAASRAVGDLGGEFALVREANLALLRPLAEEAWRRAGIANGNRVSVRALAYIMAGHVRHHLEVLRTRYGVVAS